MLAGVLLGPSLFGLLWPQWSVKLFPPDSMKVLFTISQFGLAAYMFVVGLEFRVDIMRRRFHSALAVSIAGMVTPFILGAGLGWLFYHHTSLFPERTSLLVAIIFLGASMCITAFPMLARIILFKKLTGTTIGTVALAAGAIDDAAAWCLLAVVLASFDGAFSHAVTTIVGGIAYVNLVLLIVRPLLKRRARDIEQRGHLSDQEFAICVVLLAIGAWFTDAIGLHGVFGAFNMGIAMPRGLAVRSLIERATSLRSAG
jgi:Kef-type K+ transport system membrane component KefB